MWRILVLMFLLHGCGITSKTTPPGFKNPSAYGVVSKVTFQKPERQFFFSEPSIVINRKNTANIVAGAVLDNVFYSTDTGKTWQHRRLRSTFGVWGDPMLVSDPGGRIYYFHLAQGGVTGHWLEGIVMQYSDDGGKTWDSGTLIGKNGTKQQDKPWPAVDDTGKRLAVAWTEFDKYQSKNPADKSRVLISFSNDKGETWTKPVKVNDTDGDCLDDDYTVEGIVPLFHGGTIYAVWAFDNKIWFDYSTDGGKTWNNDKVIAKQEAGWAFDIDGIYRTNGLPNFVKDNHGNFYVVFGDKNEKTGGDIKLVMSKDRGKTWSEPVIIGDLERGQFFPAAAFDNHTGHLVILYYDRSQTEGIDTEVKLLFYRLGKGAVKTLTLTEKPFRPDKKLFFGDYIDIDIHNGIITTVWTEIRNFEFTLNTTILRYGAEEKN